MAECWLEKSMTGGSPGEWTKQWRRVLEIYVMYRSRQGQAEPKRPFPRLSGHGLWEGAEANGLGPVLEELGYQVRNQGKDSVIGKRGTRSVNA